jgi:ABC-type Mn2+/Zn2+ transport system permease subunit
MYNVTNHTRPNINNSIEIIFTRIHLYLSYVILVFGIFGNIISLFIFTRTNLNKKTNTGILYTLLCVLNLLTYINSSLFGNYSVYLFGNKALLLNPQFPCKIEFFTENSLKELLSWLQVLICFDRFILVIYPTKAYIMRKKVYWL